MGSITRAKLKPTRQSKQHEATASINCRLSRFSFQTLQTICKPTPKSNAALKLEILKNRHEKMPISNFGMIPRKTSDAGVIIKLEKNPATIQGIKRGFSLPNSLIRWRKAIHTHVISNSTKTLRSQV